MTSNESPWRTGLEFFCQFQLTEVIENFLAGLAHVIAEMVDFTLAMYLYFASIYTAVQHYVNPVPNIWNPTDSQEISKRTNMHKFIQRLVECNNERISSKS